MAFVYLALFIGGIVLLRFIVGFVFEAGWDAASGLFGRSSGTKRGPDAPDVLPGSRASAQPRTSDAGSRADLPPLPELPRAGTRPAEPTASPTERSVVPLWSASPDPPASPSAPPAAPPSPAQRPPAAPEPPGSAIRNTMGRSDRS